MQLFYFGVKGIGQEEANDCLFKEGMALPAHTTDCKKILIVIL